MNNYFLKEKKYRVLRKQVLRAINIVIFCAGNGSLSHSDTRKNHF